MLTKKIEKLEQQLEALVSSVQGMGRSEKRLTQGLASWIQNNLFIRVEGGGIEPFLLRKQQKIFLAYVVKCLKQKRPVRAIILKSRQLGFSTLIEAIFLYLVHHHRETKALVLAHKSESSETIFEITKRYYDYLPESEKKSLKGNRTNKRSLDYEFPHSSQFRVLTAGGDEIARGSTFQYVHESESAFFINPDKIRASLNACVPSSTKTHFSFHVKESTACGDNWFKDDWDNAGLEESEWVRFFFSWRDDPRCYIKPPTDFEIDDVEREYQTKYELTDGQVLWARHIRINDYGGSWELFHQEQPVAPELAFQYSGNPVFDPERVGAMMERAGSGKY